MMSASLFAQRRILRPGRFARFFLRLVDSDARKRSATERGRFADDEPRAGSAWDASDLCIHDLTAMPADTTSRREF